MVIMKHILFDLKGCSADLLDDAKHVRNRFTPSIIEVLDKPKSKSKGFA